MSFDKNAYTVHEKERAVDVTLNLEEPIPYGDYDLTLVIDDGTTSELCSVNVY